MTQLAKINFVLLLTFFLVSCFGPVKELKYQIEDSWDETSYDISDPTPLKAITNDDNINIVMLDSFDGESKRNFTLSNLHNQIIYATYHGSILSFDLEKNLMSWSYKYGKRITSGISSFNDNIFFVDYDGYLICLSSLGIINWKAFVGEVFSPVLALEKYVVVKTNDSQFIALNNLDGSVIWNYKVPSSPLPVRSWGELTESEGIIYSGISSGKVVAINAKDGLLIWEATFSAPHGISEIERSNDTTSKIVVDDFAIYAVSSKGNIAAISKLEGNILWSRPLSSFVGIAKFEENLVVTHNSGAIYCISKLNNKVLWRNADFLGRDVSKPFIFNNYVIVSDFEGYLHFLNIINGKVESRLKIDDSPLLYPLTISDAFFITSSLRGNFYKISVKKKLLNEKNNDSNISVPGDSDSINRNNLDSPEDDKSIIDTLIFWD